MLAVASVVVVVVVAVVVVVRCVVSVEVAEVVVVSPTVVSSRAAVGSGSETSIGMSRESRTLSKFACVAELPSGTDRTILMWSPTKESVGAGSTYSCTSIKWPLPATKSACVMSALLSSAPDSTERSCIVAPGKVS